MEETFINRPEINISANNVTIRNNKTSVADLKEAIYSPPKSTQFSIKEQTKIESGCSASPLTDKSYFM